MNTQTPHRVWRRIFALLPQKQKLEFFIVLLILASPLYSARSRR